MSDTWGHQISTIFCIFSHFKFKMLISILCVLFLPECKIQHFKAFLYVEDVGLGLDMLDQFFWTDVNQTHAANQHRGVLDSVGLVVVDPP